MDHRSQIENTPDPGSQFKKKENESIRNGKNYKSNSKVKKYTIDPSSHLKNNKKPMMKIRKMSQIPVAM